MRRLVIGVVVLVAVSSVIGQGQKELKYMGVQGCGCHKMEKLGKQIQIWEEDPHSKAYESLLSEESKRYARRHKIKAAEQEPDCLRCHATYHGLSEEQRNGITLEEGVSCEGCHGPGSQYRKFAVMKNREEARAVGLEKFDTKEDYERICNRCHNKEIPKQFRKVRKDLVKDWQAYAHPTPEQEE